MDFEASGPTLGGKFTTIEGLLTNVGDHLKSLNPFGFGDGFSSSGGKLKGFLDNLDKVFRKTMFVTEIDLFTGPPILFT